MEHMTFFFAAYGIYIARYFFMNGLHFEEV